MRTDMMTHSADLVDTKLDHWHWARYQERRFHGRWASAYLGEFVSADANK